MQIPYTNVFISNTEPLHSCPTTHHLGSATLSMQVLKLAKPSLPTTLSTVRSGPMRTKVRTEPNPQVLGSVLCEGGLDPYLQVRGPSLSGPDLGVEPSSDLVRTSKKCGEVTEVTLAGASLCDICHITQRRPTPWTGWQQQLQLQLPTPTTTTTTTTAAPAAAPPPTMTRMTTTAAAAAATANEDDNNNCCSCHC